MKEDFLLEAGVSANSPLITLKQNGFKPISLIIRKRDLERNALPSTAI